MLWTSAQFASEYLPRYLKLKLWAGNDSMPLSDFYAWSGTCNVPSQAFLLLC
jgi:hypothetical protein